MYIYIHEFWTTQPPASMLIMRHSWTKKNNNNNKIKQRTWGMMDEWLKILAKHKMKSVRWSCVKTPSTWHTATRCQPFSKDSPRLRHLGFSNWQLTAGLKPRSCWTCLDFSLPHRCIKVALDDCKGCKGHLKHPSIQAGWRSHTHL